MKIAVIGAGFGGLSAAYDLTKAGHQVSAADLFPQMIEKSQQNACE